MFKGIRQSIYSYISLSLVVHIVFLGFLFNQSKELDETLVGSVDQVEVLPIDMAKVQIMNEVPKPLKKSITNKKVFTKTSKKVAKKKIIQPRKASVKGVKSKKVISEYAKQLQEYLDKNKRYPRMAARLGQSGIVKVKVSIGANGGFNDIKIISPAPFDSLNNNTVDLLKKLGKFKPLPKEFFPNEDFIIPIVYKMARRY